jgi:hypothetical protein
MNGAYPTAIDFALSAGLVALVSWVRITALGDSPPVMLSGTGAASGFQWVEAVIDGTHAVGQGWLTGEGDFSIQLQAEGSISVDIDPGSGAYNTGS